MDLRKGIVSAGPNGIKIETYSDSRKSQKGSDRKKKGDIAPSDHEHYNRPKVKTALNKLISDKSDRDER